MPKPVQKILLLVCFFLSGSCDSSAQEKNRSAQEFISTIQSTLDSFSSTAENFAAYLEVVAPIAEHHPDYKLTRNKIDSLKNYYTIYMNSLAEGISKLSALNEFDTSLKMATPCLYFLKKTKDAYTSTFPSWFKIYQVGWDKAKDSDRQVMLNSSKILREANRSSAKELRNMGMIIDQFKHKYSLN